LKASAARKLADDGNSMQEQCCTVERTVSTLSLARSEQGFPLPTASLQS